MYYRMAFDVCFCDMQRGVYFEITYSSLISDVQSRKQMISNAKVRIGVPTFFISIMVSNELTLHT